MTPPLVSFGVPVYNGADLLPRALDSILAQTFQDFEVVIVDNASTDDTPDVAKQYAALDGRISYHRNLSNVGLVANFNRAFDLSRGEFFKWATHDDYIHPTFTAACLAGLAEAPMSTLACTGTLIHDRSGCQIGAWVPPMKLESPSVSLRTRSLLHSMDETHPMFGLVRSAALRTAGPFGSYLAASRVLLYRLILLGPFAVNQSPLYHYTEYRPPGRVYSLYNDPTREGQFQMRTWRAFGEHVRASGAIPPAFHDKLLTAVSSARRFALQERRLMMAELYHLALHTMQRMGEAMPGKGYQS